MGKRPAAVMVCEGSARFWAVDLHVHTPASKDVVPQQYGVVSPEDVVRAALATGLDAIAVTDHNTADWCEPVGEAASGTSLIVLPGIEITTTEGHLLAIWEEGTSRRHLEDCLTKLGIEGDDRGQLATNASKGIGEAAQIVAQCGGLAIAAHADAPKGLLGLPVASHVRDTLLLDALAAVELVDAAKADSVQRKVGEQREIAIVRGSDAMVAGQAGHRLGGIGTRRTWLKASRPDLVALRHAFDDPRLRIRLEDPGDEPAHPHLMSVVIAGGFLDRVDLPFSPDVNCLVGGTGAGKSLTLECIRYALDQQVDAQAFPQIAEEVRRRLHDALGVNGTITLTVAGADGNEYVIERVFDDRSQTPCVVRQRLDDGDLVEIGSHPRDILSVSAFSQGEALEYSRHSVGRMALVDAGCDLREVEETLDLLHDRLTANGSALLQQRKVVVGLRTLIARKDELAKQVEELERLFDSQVVKDQKAWQRDDATLKKVLASLPQVGDLALDIKPQTPAAQVGETTTCWPRRQTP
jgi:hypothetical protein